MVLAEARTLESGHGIASLDEWTSNTADPHQDYPIKFNTPAQVKRPFRPFQPAGVPAGHWCVTPLVLSDILDISGLVGWVGVIVNLEGGDTEAAFLATQVSAGTPSHLTQIYGFLEYVNNH